MNKSEFLFKGILFGCVWICCLSRADDLEVSPIACDKAKTISEQIICLDSEVSDIDALNNRIYKNLLLELEKRYFKKDPKQYEFLKSKLDLSVKSWIEYRDSFCDLETVHISDADEKNEFYKQCLKVVIKNRVEELRIIQLNLRNTQYQTQYQSTIK